MELDALIGVPEIRTLTKLSRASIWKAVRTGRLPRPIKLTARPSLWRYRDIVEFIAEAERKSRPEVNNPQ